MDYKTSNDILKYIKNEKDISRYKISTINSKSTISSAKKRIIDIEREFLNLPLEYMDFEDVADVAAAISIYRSSRSLFYQTYHIDPPNFISVDKNLLLQIIEKKAKFIYKIGYEFSTIRVEELNPVQNSDFYYDFAKRQSIKNQTTIEVEKRYLDSLDLDDLLKIEPLILAKKRARVQAVVYSIGMYLGKSIQKFEFSESMTIEHLKDINYKLDSIIISLKDNIFKYYNYALDNLPNHLNSTMGKNIYLSKIHKLQNLMNFDELKDYQCTPTPLEKSYGFSNDQPLIGNILYGSKKAIVNSPGKDSEKNIQNKVFGILLPIPRQGNEKMSLLHKEVYLNNINISDLFSDNISNVKAMFQQKNIYFKALLMQPIWKLIQMATSDNNSRKALTTLLGIPTEEFERIDFNDSSIIKLINRLNNEYLPIDSTSIILTPKTRSEEEGIADIFSIINAKITEITDDYNKLISVADEIISG